MPGPSETPGRCRERVGMATVTEAEVAACAACDVALPVQPPPPSFCPRHAAFCAACLPIALAAKLPPPSVLAGLAAPPPVTCLAVDQETGALCATVCPPAAAPGFLPPRIAAAYARALARRELASAAGQLVAAPRSEALVECRQARCRAAWIVAVPDAGIGAGAVECRTPCPGCAVDITVVRNESDGPLHQDVPAIAAPSLVAAAHNVASRLWLWLFTRPCPQCGIALSRAAGCRYIACTQCRCEVCFACGQEFHAVKTTWCWQGLDTPWHAWIRSQVQQAVTVVAFHALLAACLTVGAQLAPMVPVPAIALPRLSAVTPFQALPALPALPAWFTLPHIPVVTPAVRTVAGALIRLLVRAAHASAAAARSVAYIITLPSALLIAAFRRMISSTAAVVVSCRPVHALVRAVLPPVI
ncbi:uncharacterized protein AMSG_00419 [Thecamonas trahens ATCC 50062]|uniref:IBR domain-containing protein n=1 Tax=Thecamonas trahens ATCC 50062 TaxID=461836 RepID=A0A0L0D8E9_THETB|nr:hypothetical protein AMSG_00419 [Thecamonas trahens ATCC 50062]KNC48642.1 hypothetical protein AMSG_00419 [Thecamonas trahens ATCC 50062]|eukprot:XP_013762698.1 hypothetical protein AMSG_00419 [Thecamonas trahens ATCC 50062]